VVLSEVIEKNQVPDVNFTIIYTAVRKLNSFAIRLAKISHSLILVFGYQLSPTETKILRENHLSFFSSKIIYELTNKLREIAKSQKEKKQVEKERGVAKVIRTFYFSRIGSIAGCLVVKNKISRNDLVRVFREEKKIFTGKIKSLESKNKRELEVINGQECGLVLEGFNDFKVGDKVMAFQVFEEDVV
jgi:translation initiation factor IF-2